MSKEYEGTPPGEVSIDNAVISDIALKAASDVKGVHAPPRTLTRRILGMLQRSRQAEGVTLDFTGSSELSIALRLTVEYGASIPSVAEEIQENVRHAIEYMTGLTVTDVTVKIIGMHSRALARPHRAHTASPESTAPEA